MSDILNNAIVWITGARGVGKSTLAWQYYNPTQALLSRVFGHDAERSANRIIQQLADANLSLGYYGDLGKRFDNLPEGDDLLHRMSQGKLPWVDGKEKTALRGYYEYILSNLDEKLLKGKFDVYVHDPIGPFEGGMAAWCEDNIKMFGYPTIRKAMQHGRFWSDVVYGAYRQFFSSIFDRGVKVIVLVSHLKNPWRNNEPVPGKVAPGGKPLLYLLSSLVIWLVNEPDNLDGAPAGLVLKERLGKVKVVDGKWENERMLPQRIPHCTWDDIRHYLEHGCDMTDDALKMRPSEKAMISELLTQEQLKLMILSAQERVQNGGGHVDTDDNITTPVALPTPAYASAKEKVGKLLSEGKAVTKEAILAMYPPPVQVKQEVLDAIEQVMGE